MALSNHIQLHNDKLIVTFRFDPKIVEAIKKIDGRKWNATNKCWEIPVANVIETLELLLPLGFIANLDVMRLKEKHDKLFKEIEEIKASTDQPYTGSLPLYDFQRKGASFLKSMPMALLADVPGIGKSIQTLAGTEEESQILIFCPASLKYSWQTEIIKWIPDAKIAVINGTKEERTTQWFYAKKNKIKYMIANYELLIYDIDEMRDYEWPVIVCDEATRISNPDAQTTMNLKTLKAKKRIALTGTPISNAADDIFSIMDWLVPGYLGTYHQFQNKYCKMTEEYNWRSGQNYQRITGYQNLDELSNKVNKFMLRRTKEEVFEDFPPKVIEDVVFQLSDGERKTYEGIKQVIQEELATMSIDTSTIENIMVKVLRLKQCTDHTKLVGAEKPESTKLQLLKDMLTPIVASGGKAIIFTQFAEMLHIMREALKEFRPLVVYGAVDSVDRMAAVSEFNKDPEGRVIIMTEAGAYGLNMQTASYVVHYDAPWSIAKLQQREDRAHRNGVGKAGITVYNMIAKDTIDEYVMKVLHKKNRVSVDVLKDVDRLEQAGISIEDINNILRL